MAKRRSIQAARPFRNHHGLETPSTQNGWASQFGPDHRRRAARQARPLSPTNIAFNAAGASCADQEEGIAPEKSGARGVAFFFSLEMSADQLATRILAEQSGISSERFYVWARSASKDSATARAAGGAGDAALYIDDTPGLTIAALRTRARRHEKAGRHRAGRGRYLQLLQGTGKNPRRQPCSRKFRKSRGG